LPDINSKIRDDMEEGWEVLQGSEMRQKYGLFKENRPAIRLSLERVPQSLRHLVQLAEKYGIGDDLIRADFIKNCPFEEFEELRRVVREHDDLLDRWLAGPEANGPNFSDEYIAFSCMRIAADESA
jgi:hypothetical protein